MKSLIPELNKDSKYYYLNNKKYLRVSRVSEIFNNIELNNWKASVGLEYAEQYAQETSDIGTEIHKLISDIINGKSFNNQEGSLAWALMAQELKNGVRAYIQAQKSINFVPLQSEIWLHSDELEIAGTSDCLVTVQDSPYLQDGSYLFDWKTGNIRNFATQEVYWEIKFQLSAYYHLYGGALKGCCACRLNRETGFWTPNDLYFMSPNELKEVFNECFLPLLRVYRYTRKEK